MGVPVSRIGSFALVLILAGCSSGATESLGPGSYLPVAAADVRVVNATGRPFAFFAIAADLAPLLDPVPEMPVNNPHIQVVPPGGERPVGEIPGRAEAPEGGVAVYLYAITVDGERARFTDVQLRSGAEIRLAGGRIVIRRFPSSS
jgi:hypothetical protein